MRHRLQIDPRWQGFTLLELLVAISTFTLIMTASFGALRLGNRSFEAGISRANQTENVRATVDLLRRQFAQIVPVVHELDGESTSSFSGDEERIRFIAPAPQHGSDAGLFVFTISSPPIDDGRQLVLSYAPYDPGREDFDYLPVSRQQVLIESLAEVGFAYYGASDPDDNPDWHAVWFAEDNALPRMVRILTEPTVEKANWPDLSFAIRAGERE